MTSDAWELAECLAVEVFWCWCCAFSWLIPDVDVWGSE
jgi:hypothetical protein